ncbi:MAG: DUF4351 domain-containing protein [Clostridium sp.]
MQRGKHKNLPKRLRYYQGNIDLDLIQKGRHRYSFESVCVEDDTIKLLDDTTKIILNTKGLMKDIDEELLEFLEYVENSNEDIVKKSSGNLVKRIHKKVVDVKKDKRMEVEFMTLLERDREKIEEGEVRGEKQMLLKLLNKKFPNISEQYIKKINEASKESIERISEDIFDIKEVVELDKYFQ